MSLRSPLVLKTTRPSRLAKIVSSRPIPAPGPGRKRVPRWRTMIVPAVTPCPSKTLTPSILGAESLLVSHLLLLLRFERCERTFALRVRALVLQRRRDLLRRPAWNLLGDVL